MTICDRLETQLSTAATQRGLLLDASFTKRSQATHPMSRELWRRADCAVES
jgi:hypothetical protein